MSNRREEYTYDHTGRLVKMDQIKNTFNYRPLTDEYVKVDHKTINKYYIKYLTTGN